MKSKVLRILFHAGFHLIHFCIGRMHDRKQLEYAESVSQFIHCRISHMLQVISENLQGDEIKDGKQEN